jgi:hypothetical protein
MIWFPHVGNLRKTAPDGMNIIVVLGKHDEKGYLDSAFCTKMLQQKY